MIAILLDGGLVTDVITDDQEMEGQEVLIMDYDIEGADEAGLTEIISPGGHKAMAAVHTDTIQKTGLTLWKIKADSMVETDPLAGLSRYACGIGQDDSDRYADMEDDPEGEWVRLEDVRGLLKGKQ